MSCHFHTLPNGIRLVHKREALPVAYCGIAINTGTRDEAPHEQGLAHFTEHMLFKGTGRRRATHIINRLEDVGGELNAFTNKEETVVYAVSLKEDFARAADLIGDMVFGSVFPEAEIEKEIEVVIDEINSYRDSPSELIFDDFEDLIFEGNAIGRNILGEEDLLRKLRQKNLLNFVENNYHTDEMVFFSLSDFDFNKVKQMAEKLFGDVPARLRHRRREAITAYVPQQTETKRDTNQTHIVVGNRAFSLNDDNRQSLYLLNNIIGGPGLNSLLNLALRERRGLAYTVESSYTAYTDTGTFCIYAGTDPRNKERCLSLINKELQALREKPIADHKLEKYKKQFLGQLAISTQNKESVALGMGKSFLHFNRIETMDEVRRKIENITAKNLQNIACELFDKNRISTLIYS